MTKSFGDIFLKQFLDGKKKEAKTRVDSYERLEKEFRKAIKEKNHDQAEVLKKILDASDKRNGNKQAA